MIILHFAVCFVGPFNFEDDSEAINAGTSYLTANQVKVKQTSVKPVRMVLQAQGDGMYIRVTCMYASGLEKTKTEEWAK